MDNKALIKVIQDLLDSQEELMAGVGNIVCDIGLLNTSRIEAEAALVTLKSDNTDERLKLLDALEAGGVDN